MSKNKLSFALVVMIIATGCNTQPSNETTRPGANTERAQAGNDDNRPPAGNVPGTRAETEEITQIFLDGEEFTELFGDNFSISNPSALQLRELEEVAAEKSDSEKENLEEKIQKCKAAPARCEIISD